MKNCFIFICVVIFTISVYAEEIKLSSIPETINIDLIKAFKSRKSTRTFSKKEISKKNLSTILWCANGINRKNNRHTAPSAFEKYFINIYVADSTAVYLYKPNEEKLKLLKNENIKSDIVKKKKLAEASHILIITANISKLPFYLKKEQKKELANANAGCITENIYLIANALDLGTIMVGYIDKDKIVEKLNLKKKEIPLYIMPIGYKK